ncbi:hypothetical protein [Saccharopolyspora cebuensis]|uniref:Uncharacterized protein n=1 Tax=Saccharopolyspora cebuensis TaxID=418759 RepID=A0ABV4CHW3_9PSEU
METNRRKPATAGTVVGWITLSLALCVWVLIIPLTSSALLFASEVSIEAGFAAFAAVFYGIVGALGLSAVLHSEHRSRKAAGWVYGIFLLLAAAVAISLNLRA